MKKTILAIILLLGLLGWTVFDYQMKKNEEKQTVKTASFPAAALKTGIEKGNMAPDFELTTLAGDSVRLSDFRGSKVILNFWATWCPPCKAEIPQMEEFYKENKDHNITILAVNLTTAEKNKNDIQQFVNSQNLTYPILLDEQGTIRDLFQIVTIPTSFIIDKKGVIQEKIVGPMSKETMQTLISQIN